MNLFQILKTVLSEKAIEEGWDGQLIIYRFSRLHVLYNNNGIRQLRRKTYLVVETRESLTPLPGIVDRFIRSPCIRVSIHFSNHFSTSFILDATADV